MSPGNKDDFAREEWDLAESNRAFGQARSHDHIVSPVKPLPEALRFYNHLIKINPIFKKPFITL